MVVLIAEGHVTVVVSPQVVIAVAVERAFDETVLIIIHNRMRHLRLHFSFSFQAESTFFLVLGFLKYNGWLRLIKRETPQPSFFLSLYLMSSIAY